MVQEILLNASNDLHLQNAYSRYSETRHLVALIGIPKVAEKTVLRHKLCIKLFHTNPEFGRALCRWLQDLLTADTLTLPDVEIVRGGLGAINRCLDRMREGQVSGSRKVVKFE